MRVAGSEQIGAFQKKHPDSVASLNRWVEIVEAAAWKTPADVRATYASVDFVGGKAVFNIGGNKYRLIALIGFTARIVSVEVILTHKDYDKGKWK